VECGFERLAEVQEEILAVRGGARPVIWATQVLQTLAKNGILSGGDHGRRLGGGRSA